MTNSARDCSISLRCLPGTDFDHVTFNVLQMFKVNWSKVKVTTWHNVSAAKTL